MLKTGSETDHTTYAVPNTQTQKTTIKEDTMHAKRHHGVLVTAMVCAVSLLGVASVPMAASADDSDDQVAMYRMYNPNSGEHFYTAKTSERDDLSSIGWRYEGVGWMAPAHSDTPVYRLYNPYTSDHHYTMNSLERDNLTAIGWNYEGIGWYSSDTNRNYPLYRQFNPYANIGSHNYTMDVAEKNHLVSIGWRDEGVAWYAVGTGFSIPQTTPDNNGNNSSGNNGNVNNNNGSNGSSSGSNDVYYKNCDAVRAAGKAPLYRGQPGYRPALDRDNDGVACEVK